MLGPQGEGCGWVWVRNIQEMAWAVLALQPGTAGWHAEGEEEVVLNLGSLVSVLSAGAAAVLCLHLDEVSIRAGWRWPLPGPVCPAGLPVCPLCLGLAVGAPSSSCFGWRGGSLSRLEH